MDSSPRPVRRFSRWKTTKRTFVLGGNAYVTGNKDHTASDVKDGNSGTKNEKRTKIRHSPRSPHKEKSHSSPEQQTKESSFINVDFNCKVLIHNLPDPEKAGAVFSHNEQAQNDCLVSKSLQALTVLSPNVTTTTKDNQGVISPSKGLSTEAESDGKSHSNSIGQADQLDSGPKQDSNPDSVHIDKENSTAVVTAQLERSSCSGSQSQTALVPSDLLNSKNADESAGGNSLRRRSLRNRSLLQSSSVLRHKNYPFFSVSSKKKSTDRKGNRSVNKHKLLSSPLNTVIHEKRKNKEAIEKVGIASGENHRKSSKKSEKEKTDGNLSSESHVNFQEDQSRSLSLSEIQTAAKSLSEYKDERSDCVAQVMCVSQSISRSSKRKSKDPEVEVNVSTKDVKSGAKKQKLKRGEHTSLSISSIQCTTSTSEIRKGADVHSKQDTSRPPSSLKSTKIKGKGCGGQQLSAAKNALTTSAKTQKGNTNSKSNCERSLAKGRKNVNTSHEISTHFSDVQSNTSAALMSSSGRTLRDRSALGTPQVQYPAKYMSAAWLKSLSEKAKRLLSIPETKTVKSKLSPEEERFGLKGNAKESVALTDSIPRKKTTGKLKASTLTSLKHSSQGGMSSKLSQAPVPSLSPGKQFQSKVNHRGKLGSKIAKQASSSPKNRKANTHVTSDYMSQDVSPDKLSEVPIVPDSPEFEFQKLKSHDSKSSRQPSSSPDLKKRGNCRRNAIGKRDFEKYKVTLNQADSHNEERRMSNNFSRQSKATTKNGKPIQILSSEDQRSSPSVCTSAERQMNGPFDDREQNTQISEPTCNENEDIVLNETAMGSKKGFKRRRLFQDSFTEPSKIKQRREFYESAGRDILLWSEAGEARKGSSVTSIDVIFNDIIELEDHLKDSETEYLQQRVVGKVMGRMKRSLKSQISQVEEVRELESQVKMSRDRCNKFRGDIMEHEDKLRGLDKRLKKRKECEQKNLNEWMKSFKSFMAMSRKT